MIIRSFIGPFIVTFFVALFVLIMQFFWLYMDELIGKGVSIWTLMQLLIYMGATLIPLALPLSILLASIMTFGNMGENFELVAIKSSGISLLRFLQPLLIFIVFIGGLAFFFSNNMIPVANLKAYSLLYDVRNSKPALNIKPDQFYYEIPGFSIRVGSKDEDGATIHDVMIYDHSDGIGNNKLILAREGKMIPSKDKQSLIFKLRDGWRYEEGYTRGVNDYTQTRMHFANWDKIFDLSTFAFKRTDQALFRNAHTMMNVSQLSSQIDSLKRSQVRNVSNITTYMYPYMSYGNKGKETEQMKRFVDSNGNKLAMRKYDSSFRQLIPDSLQSQALLATANNIRNFKSLVDISAQSKKLDEGNFLTYAVEWHRKFTLSFACILLFLVGAPLGAIIRKGGLGMPLVIAVVFFMAFHILNITGEKLAKADTVKPWLGMWLSTACLLPIAFWLVKAARNDSQIFTKEWYLRTWRRILSVLPVKNENIG